MAFQWLTQPGENVPPVVIRIGTRGSLQMTLTHPSEGGAGVVDQYRLDRAALADHVRKAARYAIRASTMNGTVKDFDPDAMVQNFVVGMLGYWTEDGRPSSGVTSVEPGGGGDGGSEGDRQPRGAAR